MGASVVLDHWLSALQNCAWLKPLQQRLYIVGDAGQQANIQAWAEKSPLACQAGFLGGKQILAAPIGSTAAPDQVAALSVFAANSNLPDMLIVIDGASLCEPGFSLHRFIQHSLVRSKDSVGFSSGLTEQGNQHIQLQVEGSALNPKVTGLVQVPSGTGNADSISGRCCMAPIFAFKGTSIPKLLQSGSQSLSGALQGLLQSCGVYGVQVQCSFDLSNMDGYLYADAFFGFYQQHWKLLHGQTDMTESLPAQVSTAQHVLLAKLLRSNSSATWRVYCSNTCGVQ